jgi:hypothetical protein
VGLTRLLERRRWRALAFLVIARTSAAGVRKHDCSSDVVGDAAPADEGLNERLMLRLEHPRLARDRHQARDTMFVVRKLQRTGEAD